MADEKKTKYTCPTCKAPVTEACKTFPFCCDRCQKVDLGKWFDGKFMISRPIEQSDLEQGD